ncbi:MAG: plastocyanin/azurin family copper-binding protein [bacterium]
MIRLIPSLLAVALLCLGSSASLSAQAARLVRLSADDSLHYSLTTITAKPGERLTIELRAMSMQPATQMAHNFVILRPGASVDKFVMMAGMARDTDYMPAALASQVLVASGFAAANEVVKTTFTVPTKPGAYTYFCTYPGHFNGGMKGTLVVK